jgi:hypothetical protein
MRVERIYIRFIIKIIALTLGDAVLPRPQREGMDHGVTGRLSPADSDYLARARRRLSGA